MSNQRHQSINNQNYINVANIYVERAERLNKVFSLNNANDRSFFIETIYKSFINSIRFKSIFNSKNRGTGSSSVFKFDSRPLLKGNILSTLFLSEHVVEVKSLLNYLINSYSPEQMYSVEIFLNEFGVFLDNQITAYTKHKNEVYRKSLEKGIDLFDPNTNEDDILRVQKEIYDENSPEPEPEYESYDHFIAAHTRSVGGNKKKKSVKKKKGKQKTARKISNKIFKRKTKKRRN